MVFDIFLVFLLVFANGFFVAAEFAIVKVRTTQIDTLIKGQLRTKIAKEIVAHLDSYLSATQLGITITSIGLGWIGEPAVSKLIEPLVNALGIHNSNAIHAISFGFGFSVITFLHITLGELAPKSAAIQYPKEITLGIAYPLKLFYIVFKPFIFFLNGTANLILKVFGIQPASDHELAHSEEEIRLLIADGKKSGAIDATEYKLIENIFDFTETTVKEIMVPRTQMFALDIDHPFDENFKKAVESGFTRIPVFRETVDTIIGILYVKDLFKVDRSAQQDLEKYCDPCILRRRPPALAALCMTFSSRKSILVS